MGAIPNTFIINGPGLTSPADLPPPPTAEVRKILDVKKSPDGSLWFKSWGACYTGDPSTLPDIYVVRFASGRNVGWVSASIAALLWDWFDNGRTFQITTNITIPAFTNQNFRFYYEGGGNPLTLVRATSDTRYWLYDMTLVTV